jgi:predicted Zn-dependent protease with MMP-like domain
MVWAFDQVPRGLSDRGGIVHIGGMTDASDLHELTAPDLAAFETLAMAALEALPEPWRAAALGVLIRVEDFAAPDMLSEMGMEDPFESDGPL